MKNAAKQLIKDFCIQTAPLFRSRANLDEQKTHLVVPPTGAIGSKGDIAMILGLTSLIQQRFGENGIRISKINDNPIYADLLPTFEAPPLPWGLKQLLRYSPHLSKVEAVYIIGADVLDGSYSVYRSLQRLDFARYAAAMGLSVTITGFSMRTDPAPPIKAAFRKLPASAHICPRDPVSASRVSELMGREISPVADLAFLVAPDSSAAESDVCRQIASWKTEGHQVVAINPNRQAVLNQQNSDSGETQAQVMVEFMTNAMRCVMQSIEKCRFVLISNDVRKPWPDSRLSSMIASAFDPSICVDAQDKLSMQQIKFTLGTCDAMIAGRMHCGIAGLGAGTPVVFLDYNGKVQGLLDWFGLDTRIALADDPMTASEIAADMVVTYLRNQSKYRDQIADRLGPVRKLALRNVAWASTVGDEIRSSHLDSHHGQPDRPANKG